MQKYDFFPTHNPIVDNYFFLHTPETPTPPPENA